MLAGPFAGQEFIQRFQSEASAAAKLQHPNIVSVHEVGVQEGQHFFSMDYVEGENLAQFVGNRPLPAPRAAEYLRCIAEAVDYAHGKAILHRDLKPSNILIDAARTGSGEPSPGGPSKRRVWAGRNYLLSFDGPGRPFRADLKTFLLPSSSPEPV